MIRKLRMLYILTIVVLIVGSGNAINAKNIMINHSQNVIEFQQIITSNIAVRQPAEFETMEGVLIRYPFGLSYDIIAEISEDVKVVTIVASSGEQLYVESQYVSHGIELDSCDFLITPSDTHWTRDYGPWFVFNEIVREMEVVDFQYNRPRPNDNAIPSAFASDQGLTLNYMDLEHTGGNYMTDGQGIAVSTDLVWDENRGLTPSEIDQTMSYFLDINTYHIVPDVNGEYIRHIDCWAKFLASDVILIREVSESHSQYDEIEEAVCYFESQLSSYDTPYTIERVYTPNDEPYTNSLILNDKVLVPITGSEWDDDALASYEAAMPGYEVLGFTGSWMSTDALHCRTKGIPDRNMLYVEHIPLCGEKDGVEGFNIRAKIVPYSGESTIIESTRVYYKINNDSWRSIQMEFVGNNNYSAVIPPQKNNVTIYYYIHAEDNSGRRENHPYIGAPGAHLFIVNNSVVNTPPEKPAKPSGPISGKAGEEHIYTSSTTDPNGDQVWYKWDWGNGKFSDWIGPFDSGDACNGSYTWVENGIFDIRVKAKDVIGEESEWSDPLPVNMPKNKAINPLLQLLQKLINYFTWLDNILQQLH